MNWSLLSYKVAFVLLASSARAQSPADQNLQDCVGIQNDRARLLCYDERSGFHVGAPPSVTAGGWKFSRRQDEFTSRETSLVSLDSNIEGRVGSDYPTSLILRCDGNGKYDVYVNFNGYIGGADDRVPVRFKFGDMPTVDEHWNESTDGTAAFLPDGYKDFMRGLEQRLDFIFEAKDFNGSRNLARFSSLSNNDDDLEHILLGCRGKAN